MSFWMTVLAAFVGYLAYDFFSEFIRIIINRIRLRSEDDSRRIGFGDNDKKDEKNKKTEMRKIGFGAND